ncbi:MAG: LL-diaminopimelate aminotransferase [Halobacteria archaeon]
MVFPPASRLSALPNYLFAELDEKKQRARAAGKDLVDLGVGDPDLPTPPHIVAALRKALLRPDSYGYPPYEGTEEFRQAVAEWYRKHKGVNLDPKSEVIALIGSKEGIGHAPLALLDPGDSALLPDPGYPVYSNSVILAGARPIPMPVTEEREFLPDFAAIPSSVSASGEARAKLMFLNYPGNPTAAVAYPGFYKEAVEFARERGVAVLHDHAYGEVTFDGYAAPSFLSAPGAMEAGIEFHSLSKTYCMTGWRIGFAAGNAEILKHLLKFKTQVDSGAFKALQSAGAAALTGPQAAVKKMREIFQKRRDLFLDGLRAAGLRAPKPKATFYVWARVPAGETSASFASRLLEGPGIVATPGNGFGIPLPEGRGEEHRQVRPAGEGYVRFSLTQPTPRIREAVKRLERLKVSGGR